MTQAVEGYILGDSSLFQKVFVQPTDAVRAVEIPSYRGGEHDRVAGVFGVFLDQQVDGLLRQIDRPHRVGGLGLGHLHLAVDSSCGFGDAQGLSFQVKVIPEEGHQLTPADARGQFQVEHGEDSVFISGGEVGTDFVCWKGVHLLLFFGRELASSGGDIGNEAFLHRLVEALAKHGVKAADGLVAEAQVFHALVTFDPALGLGLVVELLEIQCGELAEFDFADVGHDVLVDVVLVVGGGGLPDRGLSVVLEPGFHPLAYRKLARFAGIDFSRQLQCRRQFFFAFFLGFCQDVFVDGFACFRVVACCVAALPAAVLALANIALAVGALLSRLDQLLPGNGRPVPAHRNSC